MAEREATPMDQAVFDAALAAEVAKGTDRRVAEGRARAAGVRAYRKAHPEAEAEHAAGARPAPAAAAVAGDGGGAGPAFGHPPVRSLAQLLGQDPVEGLLVLR